MVPITTVLVFLCIGEVVPIAKRVTGDGDESAAPEGGGGFADYAFVSLHCLRVYLDMSYRMTIDLLKEMPQIIGDIGLEADDLPHPSTNTDRLILILTRRRSRTIPSYTGDELKFYR